MTRAGDVSRSDVTAIVLAGGRSSRFGSDKLAAELNGRPLLQHALAAVAEVAGKIILVAAPGKDPALPAEFGARIRVVHDPEAFGGPLVGLMAALESVETATAIVVGGDMPNLVPAVLGRLIAALEAGDGAAVLEVPGRLQPLPMALNVVSGRKAGAVVRGRGGRALRELLDALEVGLVPAPVWLALDPAAVTIVDIDRPADLES